MLVTAAAVLAVATLMGYTLLRNKHAMLTLPAASILVFIFYYLAVLAGEEALFLSTFLLSTVEPLGPGMVLAMFFHIDPYHIFGNILVMTFALVVYYRMREDRLVVLVYLVSGTMAHIAYLAVNYGSGTYLLGASGAVFGLLGALYALHPDERMPALIGPILVANVRVRYAVPILAVVEVFFMFYTPYDHVARVAHIGGLLFGWLLAKPLANAVRRAEKSAADRAVRDLRELATTQELREILARIEGEDDPVLRYFWTKEFFQKKFGDVKEREDGFVAGGGRYRYAKPR